MLLAIPFLSCYLQTISEHIGKYLCSCEGHFLTACFNLCSTKFLLLAEEKVQKYLLCSKHYFWPRTGCAKWNKPIIQGQPQENKLRKEKPWLFHFPKPFNILWLKVVCKWGRCLINVPQKTFVYWGDIWPDLWLNRVHWLLICFILEHKCRYNWLKLLLGLILYLCEITFAFTPSCLSFILKLLRMGMRVAQEEGLPSDSENVNWPCHPDFMIYLDLCVSYLLQAVNILHW